MSVPLITIITVCYNAEKYIEQTILNVISLPYPNLSYIIIDGQSIDDTVGIIKKYEKKLSYWVSEPDRGIYDAMNKGWSVAPDNSYILFLGAGDKIKCLPAPESFNNVDVLYGNVEVGNRLFYSKSNFMLRVGNTIHHQAELVRKAIHPTPPFSLKYKVYSDFDFNQRLLKMGAKFKKDDCFKAFALEDGVSFSFDKNEPLKIVESNFGFLYSLLARLYYAYKMGRI